MPIFYYFGVVGGGLIVLLFIADANLPRPIPREEPERHYQIRIAADRKGPEAVTFSGHTINFGPVAFAEVSAIALEPQAHPIPVAKTVAAPLRAKDPEAKPQRVAKQKVTRRNRPTYEATGARGVSRGHFAFARHEGAFNPAMF